MLNCLASQLPQIWGEISRKTAELQKGDGVETLFTSEQIGVQGNLLSDVRVFLSRFQEILRGKKNLSVERKHPSCQRPE
jgi:hypothetical protein